MKHTNVFKLICLFVIAASLCFGQGTTLTATTNSVAVTTASQDTITLTSSTGVTAAGTGGQFNTVLYIGKELMGVKSLVSGTTWKVQRGYMATRPQTYAALTVVQLGSPTGNFYTTQVSGEPAVGSSCTATALLTQPQIYLPEGHAYTCISSKWVQVNSPGKPVMGTTVASPAGLMTITGTNFIVSGTNAITGINVPAGWAAGMSFTVVPSGAFTWTTATNIGTAGTAVVGRSLTFTWSGAAWAASYL